MTATLQATLDQDSTPKGISIRVGIGLKAASLR
jgi:hypothetical protein